MTPALEAELRDLEAQLLLLEGLRASGEDGPASPIGRSPDEGPQPLSFAQERLWLVDQMVPGSAVYNVPGAVGLAGELDEAVLERCLNEIVRRHAALRTTFEAVDGQAVQIVAPSRDLPLPRVDLRALPDRRRERELHRLAAAEAGRPFDLTRGPLLRTVLLQLAADDHVLLFTMHHIVSDGWSMGILVRELGALYGTFRRGLPSPLAELPVQYSDFAVWQRRWLSGEVLEAELAFWRGRLAGLPARLELLTDRPHPAVQTFRGGSLPLALDPGLAAGLRALGLEEGATLFMALLTAFQALLARYSGQEDFGLGTPIAGRSRPEVEGLVGFFVNTLVLRADLTGDPTGRELLARVRGVTLEAYDHQHLPFEKLVEELAPERSLAYAPLFQVTFALQNAPVEPVELPGLAVRPLEVESGTAKLDLVLALGEGTSGLAGALQYNRDLFDAATVRRLLDHFRTLLAGLALAPGRRLSELPLLGEPERRQLLVEWNDTRTEPLEIPLHELFAAHAARTPDAAAVAFGDELVTYGALRRRADRLAADLAALGVGPEHVVAVAMERSVELIVAALGTLAAGGTYLPLDPGYPRERLAFMLEDSGAKVLLTQQALLGVLPAFRGDTVCLDAVAAAAPASPRGPVKLTAELASPAYVIYTSGSTGRPKAVVVPHRGLANLAPVQARLFGVGPGSRVLQFASPSFDASVSEIAMSLGSGALLCLAARESLLPGADLERLLRERAITTVTLPPSALALLRDEALPDLACLVVAGEACPADLAARWSAGRRFVNAYGPSEGTVCATAGEVVGGRPDIGRPIDNVEVHLLDRHLQPVPVGVPGELCLGGVGVARGYLGRPDLTAERFIPHALGGPRGEPGGRLYRTGDLARWLPDGTLQFLGRIDRQVKVRGFRIEPGEIEALLRRQPGVRDAAVEVRGDTPDGGRLVAYVVADGGAASVSAGALRDALRGALPEHMVPAAFVMLEALPLTPNGKVDRRALPAPDLAAAAAVYAAPRDPVEEVVADVWSELLAVERVGIHDDFFGLGGHSLLGARLMSRLFRIFGVELPLRALFEFPTVAGLAARLTAALRQGTESETPPIERVEVEVEAPLSFAQQRLWWIHQLEPDSPAYNLPVALRLQGRLTPRLLEAALGEIVERHEVLRTTFPAVEGRPVQRISPPRPLRSPLVDLSGLPGPRAEAAAAALAGAEALRPFDLSAGPLLRVALLRLGGDDHVLLFTLHHIVSDGWSTGLLVREAGELYGAFLAGRPSPLPALPIQYADFARWQRRWLQGEVLTGQLAYWTSRLAGAPPVLELPADRSRPAVLSGRGGVREVLLPADLAAALAALGRHEGATLFMTLLAAFYLLLSRYTGRDDLVVGTDVANRSRAETEDLIGFFINHLVLRADLAGDPPFRELLGRVREMALAAYAHQDLPFDRLVEELRPERDLSRQPVFQVVFTLQNLPQVPLELPGLTSSPLAAGGGTAKFDLSVGVQEEPAGLRVSAEYSSDLFDAATIDRLLGHFAALLGSAVAAPGTRLSCLEILPAGERRRLLTEICRSAAGELPREPFAHEVIAARAAERPTAVAVSHDGEVATYGELDRRAEAIARRLRDRGIGCEDRVGIFGERGIGMLATILGTFKAGAVYVPLDPRHPDPRLRAVLETAGLRLIATQNGLAARARELAPSVLCWDEPHATDAADAVAAVVPPHQLAYVFYTSGSTGVPKGAMVEHAGMLNHLWAKIDVLGLDDTSVVVQNASHCFDISVWQFLAALMTGGRVVIYGDETAMDPAGLLRAIRRDRATVLETVPTLLETMLQTAEDLAAAGESVDLPDLAQLISNAETLPVPLCRRWFERYPAVPLLNTYGPTECSDDTTHTVMHTPPPPDALRVWVGRPIPGFRIHVLDPHLNLAPLGCPGQIGMAGIGVGRGYLGDPVKTAVTFVPDPFAEEPGDRLYLSGDLGRWTPDGELDFLGRRDHQVKIRGHRVELGEVEAVLARYPGLREVVVQALEAPTGGQQLAAYLVPGAAGLDIAAVRAFLRERLPEHMVPAAFVELGALPLNANGKVDRRALPAPEPQEREVGELPRTAVQELLGTVWAEVLGRERVGLADDFFALGGHSLLATQVTSRVRAVFGVELPVRALFERPTVAEMAELVEAELGSEPSPHAPPLVPAPRDRPLPLSFAQQRLWFLDQLEPGSPLYNIPAAVRLDGPLDPRLFGMALGEIVRRHEVLRTTFPTVDGRPAQAISPPRPFPLPVVDLAGLGGAERQAQAARLAAAESARPFDLERGPVLRAVLLRLEERQHVLLLTLHHIAGDGWSVGLFLRELGLLYHAFAEGRPSPLRELAIQYADFAVWQRSWLAGEVLESQIAYWRERLAGAPAVLDLATDRPRPAVPSHRGEGWPVEPPTPLADELRRLGRREGATLFMVVLAAFQALLARHSGQGDVVIGTPVAGRNRLETEELIGFFVNTLALRVDSAGDPSCRELLARVREVTLGAYTHQELPFERLVEALQPERHLNRSPLFQVMFAFENVPQGGPGIPGLALSALPLDLEVAKFDLVLTLGESAAGLTGTLEYDADLFDRSTAARLVSHLGRLLDEIAADPAWPIGEVPLLAPAEQHQLLAEWNDSAADYAGTVCLHELVEAQVERSPDAVAVSLAGEELSYAELERRSDRLARRLRGLGVGPEVPVAVCAERSLAMVVGLLAVLKAGGAYVPLDPDYPAERLASMIADSGASLLLAQSHLAPLLPAGDARVLPLDREDGAAAPGTGRPVGGAVPDNLVYVIYTSGSTGRPKGVMAAHRGVANRLLWGQETYGLTPADRVLQKTPFSFDVSVWELFWPLVAGARLVFARPEGHRDPSYLAALVAEQGITVLHFVPSMLRAFVEAYQGEPFGSVRRMFASGEALPSDLVRRFGERFGAVELYNLYGPTEASIEVSAWLADGTAQGPTVPIGRPISNLRLHVVDPVFRPSPVGVAGELLIGGIGLARGYLGRPELTAERFVPDPFAPELEPGVRVYRTGDRARRLPDGALEFLGRVDQQVKIRGYRIEPGEIEATLDRHPAVAASAVMLREDPAAAERRLVGYVAVRPGEPGEDVTAGDLRSFLSASLPSYMVPAVFVLLEALPLKPNGKVDFHSLPAPGHERPELDAAMAEPASRAETSLARIWAEVLHLDRVGVHDNFFALGGDSILSIQMVSRANQAGLRLTPHQVFQHQTIAELAAVAGRAEAVDAEQGWVTGPVPLTPIQQWFLGDDPIDAHHFNQSLLLQSGQALDPVRLEQVIGHLLAHHDALRLRFVREREGWRQRNDATGPVPFHRVDLAGLPAARRAPSLEAAAAQAQASLDLSGGPLLRAVFFSLGGETGERLLLAIHHLAVDGVSWRILLADLETGYAQISRGEAVRLPRKTTSFKRWAERLAGHARSQELRSELGYWLAGPRMQAARLPLDGTGDHDPATLSVSLSTEETRRLVQEVPAASRAQVQEVLLAALALALRRWTGKDALLIDMEGHGREEVFGDVDLTRTVGWFTTLFPLLVDLRGEREPGAVLARVQGQVRAVPGRGFGYGVLRYLSPDPEVAARLAALPPAQVVFNYLGRFDGVAETSSLFHLAPESTGPTSSPRLQRTHLLEVGAWVGGGRLDVTFTYLETAHRAATVETLAGDFLASLRTLIALCLAGGAPEMLPPDLAMGIDPRELEEALHEIEFEGMDNE